MSFGFRTLPPFQTGRAIGYGPFYGKEPVALWPFWSKLAIDRPHIVSYVKALVGSVRWGE